MAEDEATDTDERDDTKLRTARKLFEESCDHHAKAHAEAHRAQQFFHNTECEGQWDPADVAYLREQSRPVLSFNIVKPKIETMMGMYADAQRRPVVSSSSAKTKLLADVVEIVKEQVLQDARYERKSARQFRTGVISGESALQVEVVPSSKGKGWIQVNLHRVMPFELHWDPGSIEPDRSDARHVFWDRWLSKADFVREYPDQAPEFDSLVKRGGVGDYSASAELGEMGMDISDTRDDYRDDGKTQYYADRRKNQIRVIRYEYKEWAPAWFVTDEITGQRSEIDEEQATNVEMAMQMGLPVSVEKTDVERVRVCDFIGSTMLAEYDEAGPFDGFSIVPFTYMIDEETDTAYGFVRNLFDPQQELNKSKSLEIEYIAQATAPGTTAEVGAIPDEDQYRAESRRAGGVALVAKGALTTGTVKDRVPPTPSPAVMARAASAVDLLNEISGIASTGMTSPAEQAQAGMTVAIRYHKSRQTVQDPFSNFEDCQREVVRRVVESITRSMPDDQIVAILGSEDSYVVQGGMLIEVEEGPQGQKQPKGQANLRDMRTLDWKLEFEYTSENSTLRMMQLDMMLQLKTAGVAVPDELMVEKVTTSRTERETMKKYAQAAQKSAAMSAQRESQAFMQQTQGALMIEARKGQEAARHNQATEAITAQKQQQDMALKVLDIWEAADENEKTRIFEAMRLAYDHEMAMRQEVTA